jgi:hypothetical protein
MEIVTSNDGLLTNVEVYQHIQELRASRSSNLNTFGPLQQRENVELNVLKYVSSTKVKDHSIEEVQCFLSNIKKEKYELTEGELVQLANHIPSHAVEVHLVSVNNHTAT